MDNMSGNVFNKIKVKWESLISGNAFCYALPFSVFFIWLLILLFTGKIQVARGYYIIHYIYTFDRGFISRGLPGEIISWFTDTVTPEMTMYISFALSAILALSSALCIGYTLKNVKNNNDTNKKVYLLLIILLILPVSFRTFFVDPKFDKLLWSLTLFSVLMSENRIAVCFTPFLCLLATAINPVYLFTSMFLISLVLLQKCYDNSYSKINIFACVAAYSLMIGFGIFSAESQHHLDFNSGAEMIDYFFSRYSEPVESSEKARLIRACVVDFFLPYKECIKQSFQIYCIEWGEWKTTLCNTFFIALPVFLIFTKIWIMAIKNEENRFQKFIFILFILFPLVSIPLSALSWEASRYYSNMLIVQICLLIYCLSHNNSAVVKGFSDFCGLCRKNYIVSICSVVYFSLFLLTDF